MPPRGRLNWFQRTAKMPFVQVGIPTLGGIFVAWIAVKGLVELAQDVYKGQRGFMIREGDPVRDKRDMEKYLKVGLASEVNRQLTS